ncbi:hypothetical protein CYMTET_37981 [Cymbomonas tetramitiformis]|uniref:Phosphatidylinositol N-acetylglucosaminyltransferase subunit P n=1 Tax=Cymbomonas tetramitiformis TaxID=36881 RepID=A0AAE0CCV3_9CHLO|nr:hypothetical protein CYMTET_37981 [Cymbomonas tetramitiformis]
MIREESSDAFVQGPHAQTFQDGPGEAEAYGFVGWVTSAVACAVFFVWAYLPDQVLESVGITYYPSKYWALAVPAYVCVFVVFLYMAYESLNQMAVPSRDSLNTFTDRHALPSLHRHTSKDVIPEVHDIPIAAVNKLLFSSHGQSSGKFVG